MQMHLANSVMTRQKGDIGESIKADKGMIGKTMLWGAEDAAATSLRSMETETEDEEEKEAEETSEASEFEDGEVQEGDGEVVVINRRRPNIFGQLRDVSEWSEHRHGEDGAKVGVEMLHLDSLTLYRINQVRGVMLSTSMCLSVVGTILQTCDDDDDDGAEEETSGAGDEEEVLRSVTEEMEMSGDDEMEEGELRGEGAEEVVVLNQRRNLFGVMRNSNEWSEFRHGVDGVAAGLTSKAKLYTVYTLLSTLSYLLYILNIKEVADTLCPLCGLDVCSGKTACDSKLRSVAKHLQQHFVLRVCGCQKLFLVDDTIRNHRKSSTPAECPDWIDKDASKKIYPPILLVDRESYPVVVAALRKKHPSFPPLGLSFPVQAMGNSQAILLPRRNPKKLTKRPKLTTDTTDTTTTLAESAMSGETSSASTLTTERKRDRRSDRGGRKTKRSKTSTSGSAASSYPPPDSLSADFHLLFGSDSSSFPPQPDYNTPPTPTWDIPITPSTERQRTTNFSDIPTITTITTTNNSTTLDIDTTSSISAILLRPPSSFLPNESLDCSSAPATDSTPDITNTNTNTTTTTTTTSVIIAPLSSSSSSPPDTDIFSTTAAAAATVSISPPSASLFTPDNTTDITTDNPTDNTTDQPADNPTDNPTDHNTTDNNTTDTAGHPALASGSQLTTPGVSFAGAYSSRGEERAGMSGMGSRAVSIQEMQRRLEVEEKRDELAAGRVKILEELAVARLAALESRVSLTLARHNLARTESSSGH